MRCAWCRGELSVTARRDSKFCSKRCRQASHRFGKDCIERERAAHPLRLAYADPPYPGKSRRYYQTHRDYAGEVDHRELLSRLQAFDGWALSTSADALPMVLAMAVAQDLPVRVGAWFRGERKTLSAWPLSAWEPVVYAGGRRLVSRDVERDALIHFSRPRTTDPLRVVGAKPAKFCYWLFGILGARPGDDLVDLFPGSGGVSRAWERYSSPRAPRNASPPGRADESLVDDVDASRAAARDARQLSWLEPEDG